MSEGAYNYRPDVIERDCAPNHWFAARRLRAAGVDFICEWTILDPDDPNPPRTAKGRPKGWRHDFYIPAQGGRGPAALEIEGGLGYNDKGRHTRFHGAREDCHKYAVSAARRGVMLFRTTSDVATQELVIRELLRYVRGA